MSEIISEEKKTKTTDKENMKTNNKVDTDHACSR